MVGPGALENCNTIYLFSLNMARVVIYSDAAMKAAVAILVSVVPCAPDPAPCQDSGVCRGSGSGAEWERHHQELPGSRCGSTGALPPHGER